MVLPFKHTNCVFLDRADLPLDWAVQHGPQSMNTQPLYPSPHRVSCPGSWAAWMMIMAAFSLSVLLWGACRWKERGRRTASRWLYPLRWERLPDAAAGLCVLVQSSSYRGRTLRMRNFVGTIPLTPLGTRVDLRCR